ncbi:MAG: filamentous hemagglutinin N-terminal domain-containing protein, partial [Microcoleaceae cyanobacterium]
MTFDLADFPLTTPIPSDNLILNEFKVAAMILQNTRQFRLVLSVLSVILLPAPLNAQPIVPARDGTGTIVTPQDHQFDITGGQLSGDRTNLFHSFERLGLSEGQILNFLSSPEIQNILGRVTGGEASFIDGLIQVTGGNSNLFLMNPAGIVFGQNASLNVPAAFTVTTATGIGFDSGNWFHAIQNNTWSDLIGEPNQFLFETQNPGSIVNFGNLAVSPGESLTLLAGSVLNTGTLTAPGGRITVASVPGAGRVRIGQIGHLLSLDLLPLESSQDTFNPLSLPELLTGGNIKVATTVQVTEAGEIILTESGQTVPGQPGITVILGSLNAVGTSETSLETLGKGGEINLIGDRLFIANAEINASGLNGGGTIRIGGEYKGLGLLPNASQTLIDQTTSIQANGLQSGDGGRVIIWSEEYTQVDGKISVQGGLNTGNGGFVETSSRGELAVTQAPDLFAPNGVGGTWLIDPIDITIVEEDVPDQTGSTFISVDEIEAGLATGNVTLETGTDPNIPGIGDITFNASISLNSPSEQGEPTNLTLNAANNINFQNRSIINNVPEIGDLNVDFNADIDGDGLGIININNSTIDTGGGSFTASGNGIIINQGSSIATGIGSVNLVVNPGIAATTGLEIRDSQIISTDGDINLTGISNGTTGSSDGIIVRSSRIESTGAGNINLSGIGGFGQSNSDGISLFNNAVIQSNSGTIQLTGTARGVEDSAGITISGATLGTSGGDIQLSGTSQGGGRDNDGILLGVTSGAKVSGSGNILFTGISGTSEGSDGVRLDGTEVQSFEGDIEFIGTGNGIARGQGVIIGDSLVESTGNGSITVTGVNTGSGERNRGTVIQGESTISTVAGSGTIQLSGTGGTGDGSVGFAIFSNDPALDPAIIRSGTGVVDITGTTNNDINSPSIFFGETALVGSNGGAFNLSGDREIRVRSLSTNGGAVNITSTSGSIDASGSLLDTSSTTGNGGSVTLQAFEDIEAGEIRTQTLQTSNNAVGGMVTFNAGNSITLTEDLDLSVDGGTSGNLIFNGNLRLDQPERTLTTTGNILFNGLVNGSSSNVGTHDLVLNAGTGEIQFNQAVGSITSLGDLTINSSGTTTFNSTVNAASLLTNGGGTTQLSQDVTTSGPSGQQYGNSVNLLGSITLTADEIDFAGTVSGTGQELTLQPFTANQTILLGSDSNSNPNALEITQTELNLISPDLNLLIIGTEQLSNTMDLFGDTTFRTPVVLQAQSFNASDFTLAGTDNATITLTAAEDLTAGNITNPGRDIRLTSLNGPIDTRSGTLDTSSPETDGGNIFLDAAGEIFVGAVNTSTQSLSPTDQAGTLNFTGTDVTLAGNIDLSATTGRGNSVSFTVPVQIDNEITINTAGAADSGNITFDNFINSSGNSGQDGPSLTLDAGTGTVSFSSVGAIAPLSSLQVQTAGTTTLTGDITVTDTIDFSAATSGTDLNPEFSDALTLTAQNNGNILFNNSPIRGTNTQLTLNAGTVALDQVGAEGAELAGITLQVGIANLFDNLFSRDGLDFSPVSQVNILGDRVILSTASTNGAILLPSDVEGSGLLTLKAGSGDITLGTVGNDLPLAGLEIDGGKVTGEGSITVGVGGVVIEATGEVNLNRSLVTEGTVNLSALQNLTTADITAANIILDTQQNLTTGNLSTASPNPTIEEPEAGGFVVLKALAGEITTGNINSTGTTGGNVTLQALTAIQSGQINTSGSLGSGGNVLLDPTGDVEVGWIRAEGGTEGTGGTVEIVSTGGFFRATETFPTPFSPDEPASISTASPNGGGTITIRHAGGEQGSPVAPFEVGNPTENGTEGILTTGEFVTEAPSSWPQSATLGNIIFQTDDSLTPTPNPTPTPEPTPTPTPTPNPTPTPEPTPTPTPTPNPTPTPEPTPMPTPTPNP